MVAKNTFYKLNIKQKIYKIASAIRKMEEESSQGKAIDTTAFCAYLSYVERDIDEPKIREMLSIIQEEMPDFLETLLAQHTSQLTKSLNCCFHRLLELIGESVGEGFYRAPNVRLFDKRQERRCFDTAIILDNLRSTFNVGSIFRTSDAFGVGSIALCGITPCPPSIKIERTSMGTTENTPWKHYPKALEAILHYRERGYRIVAVETTLESRPLCEAVIEPKTALIFGNEEFGITDDVLGESDFCIEIPMLGLKNSLNVANAASVVLYEVMRQRLY